MASGALLPYVCSIAGPLSKLTSLKDLLFSGPNKKIDDISYETGWIC